MSVQAIVFINKTSGGNFGQKVKDELVKRTDIFIVTLPDEPNSWQSLDKEILFNPAMKIIVCGGDGTINWVVGMLTKYYGVDNDQFRPVLAVIPLGTGNDMSNMLGWGNSFTSSKMSSLNRKVDEIIGQEHTSKNVDIWRVRINDGTEDKDIPMLNYFSIGIDASIAQKFAEKREKSPHLFTSQMASKLMYIPASFKVDDKILLKDFLIGSYINKDGQQVELDFHHSKTFVCQAITKIYAGKDLWGSDNRAVDDGMFELIRTGGVFHLAMDQVGLKTSHNIDNAKEIHLQAKNNAIFQVDGEPFVISGNTTIAIERIGSYPMLFRNKH